ncbi:MAG: hypothetical protein V4584_17120 [Verrucomicrobiota bacterium]
MHEPSEEKPNRARVIALALTAAVIFYFLSYGPALLLITKQPTAARAALVIYAPLFWCCHHVPWMSDAMMRYQGLWIDLEP